MSYPTDTAAELAGNFARNRFAEELAESTYHPDGYICQNCNRVVGRVQMVPEFEYLGCDDCMEEALSVLAGEAGCTVGETLAFLGICDSKRPVVSVQKIREVA